MQFLLILQPVKLVFCSNYVIIFSMEQYRSANSIPLRNSAPLAQQHVTQIPPRQPQVLDKVRTRRIIVRSRNLCPKHKIRKTIKQSRPHEPAAKKGFRASLVQNFFRSGTLQPLCFLVFAQFGVRFTRTNIQRQTFTDSNFSHHMHRTKRCLRAFFYIGNSIKRNSKRSFL